MEQNISSSMSTFFQVQVSLYQSQNLSMMVRATKNVFPYIRSNCFEAWKMTKKHQEAKMKEIQARSRSRKNRTVQFWIPEYPIFLEQIASEYNLRFSLFRKDLVVSYCLYKHRSWSIII
jgi:hypothetical protein